MTKQQHPKHKLHIAVTAGVLLGLAAVLSWIETLFPSPISALPFRWGLSNIAIMYAILNLGLTIALGIGLGKSLFILTLTGPMTALFSVCGGLVSILAMTLLKKAFPTKLSLFTLSATGALAHNFAQLLLARVVLPAFSLQFFILPVLLFGIVSGLLCALLLNQCMRSLKAFQATQESLETLASKPIAAAAQSKELSQGAHTKDPEVDDLSQATPSKKNHAGPDSNSSNGGSSKILAWLLLLLLPLTSACHRPSQSQELVKSQTYTDLFDTVIDLKLYGLEDAEALRLLEGAHLELKSMHQDFDRFHPYEGRNNLYTINQSQGEWVEISETLFDAITEAFTLAKKTNGAFQPALGAVTKFWQEAFSNVKQAKVPRKEDIQEALKHCRIENFELDPSQHRIRKIDPKAELDLGASAKGFAADRVLNYLKGEGAEHILLNLGGNIDTWGGRAPNRPFKVGINNPYLRLAQTSEPGSEEAKQLSRIDPELKRLIETGKSDLSTVDRVFTLISRSAVTSGPYERFFFDQGKRYHHLIDPKTGFPSDRYAAVTVLGDQSLLCDVLSTALFELSQEEGQKLLQTFQNEGLELEAIWFYLDGSQKTSPGFPEA